MLFLHEVHEVVGARELEFEAAIRDRYMPALGASDDARLLYFLHHAHGTGGSYRVVTITGVRDGASWERLARRVDAGDLTPWARDVDQLRHEVRAKMVVPLPWSPLQEIDLSSVPTTPGAHDPTMYMEDTVWPKEGLLEAYIERSGSHYAREMKQIGQLLTVNASFRTVFGSHRRREVILWQKIVNHDGLVPLLTRDVPERFRKPGTWMHDALELRDQWRSRLLRTASWSPLD
jgi:hypothetical protein